MKKIALILSALSLSANAAFMSGNDLLAKLNGNADDRTLGGYFISGAADAYMGVLACPPSTVTYRQIIDMTKTAIENTPTIREKPGDWFVLFVMKEAWPCKRGSNI